VNDKGKHRRPDHEIEPLLRRSFLLGGGALAAGTLFKMISEFDSSPETVATRDLQHLSLTPSSSPRSARNKATRGSRHSAGPSVVHSPRIHSIAEWGARKPQGEPTILRRPPRYIVVHHTSTENVTDFSPAWGFRLSRSIQNAHMAQGWGDTGQHFTISRGGHIMEGRAGSLAAAREGELLVGAHAAGANGYTVGIECEGIYNKVLPPRPLRASLVQMCAWLCTRYGLNPLEAIVPHMKFNDTDCCGYRFVPELPKLQSEVAKLIPPELTR
jgi:hypothetical protein